MDLENFANRIKDDCVKTLLEAYEDAGVQGLCAEGRWEAAVGALRALDVAQIVREFQSTGGKAPSR
jgi:hypothetical protein